MQALLKACAEGRLEDVTALLSQDTDVNTRDPKVRLLFIWLMALIKCINTWDRLN